MKIDNTKIKLGDKVLIESFPINWFSDKKLEPTFTEEIVTKITSSSIYTEHDGSKKRFNFLKTKPPVMKDFLQVFTLYRNRDEYNDFMNKKNEERLASVIDDLHYNIDVLQSILQEAKTNKLNSSSELISLNKNIQVAIHKFDDYTGTY